MTALAGIAKKGKRVEAHRPWPRAVIDGETWKLAGKELAEARATLLGLWGDHNAVHVALMEEPSAASSVLTYDGGEEKSRSAAAHCPAAGRLERSIGDLYGLKATGAPDTRSWLDLGFWGVTHPLGKAKKAPVKAKDYAFLPV